MQNKANFQKAQMNVSSLLIKDYENESLRRLLGKQSQTNPFTFSAAESADCDICKSLSSRANKITFINVYKFSMLC